MWFSLDVAGVLWAGVRVLPRHLSTHEEFAHADSIMSAPPKTAFTDTAGAPEPPARAARPSCASEPVPAPARAEAKKFCVEAIDSLVGSIPEMNTILESKCKDPETNQTSQQLVVANMMPFIAGKLAGITSSYGFPPGPMGALRAHASHCALRAPPAADAACRGRLRAQP